MNATHVKLRSFGVDIPFANNAVLSPGVVRIQQIRTYIVPLLLFFFLLVLLLLALFPLLFLTLAAFAVLLVLLALAFFLFLFLSV